MNLKAGLWQQQTLKLTMTQELSQAIALLQYSVPELAAFLENKALENPLMQIEHGDVTPVNRPADRQMRKHGSGDKDWIDQIAAKHDSIEDQLLSQLNIKKLSADQLKVIRYLIQNLDENGYLSTDLETTAETLDVSGDLAEEGLAILQTLDPIGIGARNLQECLLIQIGTNELAQKIISDYFVPFAEKKWKLISKELQVSLKEIQDVFDLVQQLNPRPGALLFSENTTYIIPDAIIERGKDGWIVRMFDDPLPKVGFNDQYYTKLSSTRDTQVSKYLQEKVQDYQWIVRSIEQRKATLTKVITKIMEKQIAFFENGPQYLQPMTMKEIAGELDIHESTVSRAVREKYVQTPVGIFPLKSFFTSTIQTVQDESASSAQVKNAIEALIENENKEKPLSDQEIADRLKSQKGMMVSRRTIAKYRDQLGIPSSSKRKRF